MRIYDKRLTEKEKTKVAKEHHGDLQIVYILGKRSTSVINIIYKVMMYNIQC